jgi:hypothetical protein
METLLCLQKVLLRAILPILAGLQGDESPTKHGIPISQGSVCITLSIAITKKQRKQYPSCAGHVDRADSKAVQRLSPSISMTTIGSSNGKISRISPRVITPCSYINPNILLKKRAVDVPGPYVESPRIVPPQMKTPSEPPPPSRHSASSYACLKTSANQFPDADYIDS